MNRWFRFTLSGLFLITLIAALVVRFWVVPIPEGLRSAEFMDSGGGEVFTEYTWYDKTTALVEASFNMDGSKCWTSHTSEAGRGSVAYLSWGSRVSAYYTVVQIQLPERVTRWQTFELKPPKMNRQLLSKKSWLNDDLSAMSVGETSIFRFMGQYGHSLTSNQVGFDGSLTVLGVTDEFITIELTLKGSTDFNIEENAKVFELARVPEIKAG